MPKINLEVDYDAKALASKKAMEVLASRLKGREEQIAQKLSRMTPEQRRDIAALLERHREVKMRDDCRLDFLTYKREVWPAAMGIEYLHGPHFDALAKVYHRIDKGEAVRVIINIAPRHGKSEDVSFLFPSWYIGKHPGNKIIQVSNVKSLADDFGQKVRNLIATEDYQAIFPGVKLASDSKAKGKWRTNKGGTYFAVGVGGTAVGKGGNLLIIDDPHSDQSVAYGGDTNTLPSKEDFDKVYNQFTTLRTRLQPGGSILIVMQRWASHDLTGRLIEKMKLEPNGDQWEIITLPALLEKTHDDGTPILKEDGEPEYVTLFPAFWPLAEMLKTKATTVPWKWNAMYQQNPGAKEGSIVRRDYWQVWGQRKDGTIDDEVVEKPPYCEFKIQSWDMGATAKDKSNYSACVTIGLFKSGGTDYNPIYNVFLLDAVRGRWEFHELKQQVVLQFRKHNPDTCVVENKSAGTQIIQELRRTGIPLMSYTPTGNQYGVKNDKVARVNAISDMFHSGMVWAQPKFWADEVIDEFAVFPHGQNDDYVDAMTQALARFRQGGFIRLPTDEQEEEDDGQAFREVVSYY